MVDQETHSSRAEQRMAAVAKLKRAASLPRMKDGRRPPMHVEAVSEGEKALSEEEKARAEAENAKREAQQTIVAKEQETREVELKTSDPDSDPSVPTSKTADADAEADTEPEERPLSPTAVFKKRRSRSRSRSRGSKDLKGKFKPPQSPVLQIGGDSSQDENPPMPTSAMLPMVPPLVSPIPHFPFLQQSRFLRSPTPVTPEMSLFYPGTSPSTPLPTLEDLQKGLMRSNSAGSSSAAGRRMAMHKLTGGTETYDPSPSPTPPPFIPKLSRNNTVSGGERIAARQNMLSRLGTRITKEADAEAASGAEDRGATSPIPKRRRRRSRRTSTTPNPNLTVSDSDFNSTNPNTPAIPVTPLPILQDHYAELRAQSTTPNQLSSSRNQSSERVSEGTTPPPPLPLHNSTEEGPKGQEQARRRSVLVEDPDEEERDSPAQRPAPLPGTPQHAFHTIDGLRGQSQFSESRSNGPSRAPSAMGGSMFYNQRAPSRNEPYPSSSFNSPFNVLLKEKALSDEDEEQVLYPATARPRTPYTNAADEYDREISWIASPVPEIRMPIDDDDDDEEEAGHEIEVHVGPEEDDEDEVPPSAASSSFTPEAFDDTSPRASSSSNKSVLVESETSPENLNPYIPASPSSPLPFSHPPSVDGSISPQFVPTRLSVASRIQSIGDRSPLTTEFSEWEDKYGPVDSSKREPSSSTWEKAKNMFTRAGSSTGRRSRTNSIVARERRDHTDSSISRESGTSLNSAKTDKGDTPGTPAQLQAPPLMQTPSASASILSLAPHAPTRGSVSPIPPPSSSDMSKYQNAKLFPFPGMLKLEEERRAKNYTLPTASNPDVSTQSNEELQAQPLGYSFSNTSTQTPDNQRERGLSRENSDQRLHVKYGAEHNTASPASSNYPDYIDVSPSPQQNGSSYNLKLPTTLPGVKQWLSKNSKKKAVSPPGSVPGTVSFSPLPVADTQTAPITNKKPSLSDIFGRKNNDLSNEWEENVAGPSNIHEDLTATKLALKPLANGVATVNTVDVIERTQTPRGPQIPSLDFTSGRASPFKFPGGPSSANRLAAATPDPSSVSDYPAPTASESSSTSSSQSSSGFQRGQLLLERLDEHLSKGFNLDDHPRKLILSSPVLQVVNPNTVKDRFLFLFNDILVIAKPVTFDQDSLMDTYKLSLPDRKYTVKSVVQLRNIRFCADRSEGNGRLPAAGPRNSLLRSFIAQFSKEPDHAIATLFTKSNIQDNPALLGQLLFKTLELDRSRLGEYLSRKTSKVVLKSYLDSFGFAGLRVDVALRVFLQSINVSRYSQSYGALEHLLDAFASRWYEANAKFVAYDKDMAARIIWALAQLNDRLHGGIADQPGHTDHLHRNVTSKEFVDAFRRYDLRYLVSDEVLQELYRSIFHERLCQAAPTISNGSQDTPIAIKRPLPGRLTYKVQSDPIVFRLPQADPELTIELYGQDLIFDPPVLHFTKSSEASFRVMGTSLGTKSITMCRSGPSAIKYSGIPLSHTIVVERSFMRNTFQLAFLNPSGAKRRYMFSIDDTIIRNEWATSLRRHIDSSTASASALTGLPQDVAKFRKAADAVAFKVLQDTLMGNHTPSHRPNGSYSTQNSSIGAISSQPTESVNPFPGTMHTRSKSRSRVYPRHGADKNELDLADRLANSSHDSNDFTESSDKAGSPDQSDGSMWTARDLEMHCHQNSSISVLLSYLQGVPESSPTPS